jgi:hypothetical protein
MVNSRGIGASVEHPQYGQGTITAIYRNGSEWLVRFESGLRFRRPRQEFIGEQASSLAPAAPLPSLDGQPMPPSRYAARQLLEALRVGVAPVQHIKALTIGLESERASLAEGLAAAHQTGGAVRAVIGEYGYRQDPPGGAGRAAQALERNFLVATTSLDLGETPAHRAHRHLPQPAARPALSRTATSAASSRWSTGRWPRPRWRGQLWTATSRGQRSAGRGAVRHRQRPPRRGSARPGASG